MTELVNRVARWFGGCPHGSVAGWYPLALGVDFRREGRENLMGCGYDWLMNPANRNRR